MVETRSEASMMEQAAGKFEAVNSAMQSMLTNLMGELEELQTAWQGAGGRSFTEVKQAWANDQSAIQNALLETATAIRTSGHQYTASDTEAASRVAATNRGVNLPL